MKPLKRKNANQNGAAMIEAAYGMVWFGAFYFFILYMYQYVEAAQESRVVSNSQIRQQMLDQYEECYWVVEHEYEAEVGNEFALEAVFKPKSMPLEINKVGYAGPCLRPFQSRYDFSNSRQPRDPRYGALLGKW